MLNMIRTKIKDFDRNSFKNLNDFYKTYEIESNIKFTQDIINASIKTKQGILYLE